MNLHKLSLAHDRELRHSVLSVVLADLPTEITGQSIAGEDTAHAALAAVVRKALTPFLETAGREEGRRAAALHQIAACDDRLGELARSRSEAPHSLWGPDLDVRLAEIGDEEAARAELKLTAELDAEDAVRALYRLRPDAVAAARLSAERATAERLAELDRERDRLAEELVTVLRSPAAAYLAAVAERDALAGADAGALTESELVAAAPDLFGVSGLAPRPDTPPGDDDQRDDDGCGRDLSAVAPALWSQRGGYDD